MKFLDIAPLARLNSFLDSVDVGDLIVKGDLEAYSCKLAGLDKKLSRSLEEEVAAGSASPSSLSKSPVGPLQESSSRKTLVYLILTLNHIYPDYDFSLLRAHHFKKEEGVTAIEETIDAHLVEASKVWETTPGFGEEPLLDCLWSSIDEAISLKECDVYSYKSDMESDPFGEKGSVWSFNYFFYNKKLKRILYLSCRGLSKTAVELSVTTDYKYNTDDEGEEVDAATSMANEMDL
ncbi:Repressor of RNA polymerase III transcription MAF1 [Chlorella sorokiniana]|uniref:Repressor of RNA polymerase III transcription n=1 Tax=Chlorella sorokiniana TaxID=3076 RepID=A0A2P6TPR9_CHLSO|nr:Repressor of RNA polymerase III transcription MAF1 [Chlorella sorokiniana]|eukprot:PRW56030.1 Repressor of RNA polymerase III transcription MAF1 [Chlorella sorokiniana]